MGETKPEITPLNVHKVCRFCLEEKVYSQPLFTTVELAMNRNETVRLEITKIVQQLTQETINQSDSLPELICYDCLELVKTSYTFHAIYKQSQQLLRSYLDKSKRSVFDCCDNSDPEEAVKPKKKRKGVKIKPEASVQPTEQNDDFDSEEIKLHACPICLKEFSAQHLKIHAHTHKALKKYLSIPDDCKVATTVSFRAANFSSDASLYSKKQTKHRCPYCDEYYEVEAFRTHVLTHRNQSDFKCQECGRVFKKLNHLNTHLVKHLKEFPYKCEYCNKGFVIKTNYDCHVLTHKTEELPHECNYCLRRFSNPEHLNRHIIQHTENVTYSVKYKVCKCSHCLKTFKDKNELRNHECKPVDCIIKTRYACKSCNKVFRQSSGLYNHNRNIHKLKGAKVLCSVCGNYVSNIYNHMLRHSGEKPFQCHQCEKRFVAKPQLRQHLLVHSGLKPYVCSTCAKAFNNLYNLQVHERIHTGNKCHVCQICNKGFLEKSYLKKHLQIHEKVH